MKILQTVKHIIMENKAGCLFLKQLGGHHISCNSLIHTDLAGPQKTSSLKVNLYYIIFIDDMTRMCWIYFLKSKLEIVGVFWNFKKRIENQSGCKIQTLRSDNGKEYTSEQFNMLCNEAGIEH